MLTAKNIDRFRTIEACFGWLQKSPERPPRNSLIVLSDYTNWQTPLRCSLCQNCSRQRDSISLLGWTSQSPSQRSSIGSLQLLFLQVIELHPPADLHVLWQLVTAPVRRDQVLHQQLHRHRRHLQRGRLHVSAGERHWFRSISDLFRCQEHLKFVE